MEPNQLLPKPTRPVLPMPAESTTWKRFIARITPTFKTPHTAMVQVIVGKEKKQFSVYKDFLCYYSPYFAGALREGTFEESISQTVTLEHTTEGIFGLFVEWLYTQKIKQIRCKKAETTATIMEKDDDDEPNLLDLAHLWILADYLQVPTLQNLAIKTWIERSFRLGFNIFPHAFQDIYDNTSPGSPLRRLWLDSCVWRPYTDTSLYKDPSIPVEMLHDIAASFANLRLHQLPKDNPLLTIENYYVKTGDETEDNKK